MLWRRRSWTSSKAKVCCKKPEYFRGRGSLLEIMLTDSLIALSTAASFGLQLVLSAILLPLAGHARGALVSAFLREILPRVYLLGLCVAALAVLLLVWRDGRPSLMVSSMLFVCLGHGLARHMLNIRSIVAKAHDEPQSVLRPLTFLGSAQLAVAMVCIVAD